MTPMDYYEIGQKSRKIKHEIIRSLIKEIRILKEVISENDFTELHNERLEFCIKRMRVKIRSVWKIYENNNFW